MKATTNQSIHDVIISGAGPVGLFLACELALAKCSVMILEKGRKSAFTAETAPVRDTRAVRPHDRGTLPPRAARRTGNLQAAQKSAHPSGQGPQRQAGHFAGIPFHEGNIDASQWEYRLPGSPETSLISEIAELETILTRRAEALGVEIRRGFPVTNVRQTGENVTVWSADKSFQAKWLVGCDGSRSIVRKMGGFEFAGTEPEFTGYTTLVDIADPEKLRPGRNVTPAGMYMQSQPGYVLMQDFDGGAFHSSEMPITREHIQEVLRRVSGTDVTINALHTATTWTDRARQATRYRNGRILLAGDAAHIHSPLGGQGLNLGLGDAMNLGWKLAATIQNRASDNLLDTYFAERHPIGAQVLDWSRAQVAIMQPAPHARALHAIFRDLINTRDGATYMAGKVWGMHMHYDLGGGHPIIGRSVPDFEFENGTKIGELMHDGRMILLDFNANASLQTLANEYCERIRYISGRVKNKLGLSSLVIRPDGIVAWVSENPDDHHEHLDHILSSYWNVVTH